MTASIQTKNERYYIVLNWKEGNKRKQKWVKTEYMVGGKNKRKLEELRRSVLEDFTARGVDKPKLLFSDYLKQWLEVSKNTISVNTYFGYKQTVENSICPFFEALNVSLEELKPYHIQDFYSYKMETDGVSATTIHRYHANIHKALRYAVKTELIADNPSDKVELPKMKKHIAEFYTAEELKQLLDNVKGTPLETVVYLASWFGLRRGEIVGLRWSSVDLERGVLSITGTVKDKGKSGSKIENLRYEPTAKNATSIRSFPLSDSVVSYFRALKKLQDKNRAANKNYNHQWDDFVCVRENGELLPLEYVSRAFPKLCEKCGLKRLKLHELRHTNISLLLEAGASIKELQEWAGHSSYTTTANIYAHLQTNSKNKLSDAMEKILA